MAKRLPRPTKFGNETLNSIGERSPIGMRGTKDAVIWTGASSKPLTKETDKPDLVAPNRRNNVFKTTVQRVDVSQAGDMAYEYSTFSIAYDDDRGHREATGALLRVWKKDGGTWKIAAQFQRPHGDISPLMSQGR
jgi:hypothetical protein